MSDAEAAEAAAEAAEAAAATGAVLSCIVLQQMHEIQHLKDMLFALGEQFIDLSWR